MPDIEPVDPETILDRFLGWVDTLGLRLYPAQEQALLELLADRHVVLGTPTGSGKSLVAAGMHFMALCYGERSFYTSPTKALASEKFFRLCEDFGPENVGMMTGDAAINRDAPIVCCTAEILANLAVREGPAGGPPCVVMDEFHFYSDPERGVAWQVPLLALPDTQFLLMSATLGDIDDIARSLEDATSREVAHVSGDERPVPLDFAYRETPIHATVESLLEARKAPVYIVSFTHRECAELAQSLTSIPVCTPEEKLSLAEALRDAELDSPYGKELGRLLRAGIAVHHAGLLPKYRLLVEQLSQRGLLKLICGTDTLGVGVNIPIRTVLFSKLAKYDGHRVRILPARDFRQIAGRAGRKGFDDRGSVVCQAPEHVIEARRQAAKKDGKRRKKSSPPRGTVVWNRETFEQLVDRPPEKLVSRFRVTHGMMIHALQRPPGSDGEPFGYGVLVDLVLRCHERAENRVPLLAEAAALFRALRRAELVAVLRDERSGRARVAVSPELQEDFSLHATLSLYLVDAVAALDPDAEDHALSVLSLVEAIQEDPRQILYAQERKAKGEAIARMKAEGVPYEERMAQLEDITYPRPLEPYIDATFDAFAARHPWVRHEDIRPKSIAREIVETGMGFADYVRRYGLQRAEGLLLRHLNQTYKALDQTVPEFHKTEGVYEIAFLLRSMLARVDSSLVAEWERMVGAGAVTGVPEGAIAAPTYDLAADERALRARVRAELQVLVRALADADYAEAERVTRTNPDDPWVAERFERAMAPFFQAHEALRFEPRYRHRSHTRLERAGARRWRVQHVLVDAEGDEDWALFGFVDLTGETNPIDPIVQIYDIAR